MIRLVPFFFAIACATGSGPEPLSPQDAPEPVPGTTEREADAPRVVAGPTAVPSPARPLTPIDVEAARTATADVQPGDTIRGAEPDLAKGTQPAAVAAIEGLLRARHSSDLPTRQVLDAHPEPGAALVWLSLHADTAAVRIRATRSLGLYPQGGHADHLASLFLADDTHPALRAASLSALAAHDAETRRRYAGLLRTLAGDGDPRVSQAASRALQGI